MSLQPDVWVRKDTTAKKVYEFDWDAWLESAAEVSSHTITIAVVSGANTTPLACDNDAIAGDGKSVSLRLTGGTSGSRYRVTCHIVTDETPAQEDDRSFYVQMADL